MSLFDELSNVATKSNISARQKKEATAAQFKPSNNYQAGLGVINDNDYHADTFFSGIEQALHRASNVFLPGPYKHKVYDTEGVAATVGELVGSFADPTLLIPVVGAEVAAGKALVGAAKVASKFGILEKATAEIGTGIGARVFKNAIAGGVGGAVDAYEHEQSNQSADYLHSTLMGAGLGVGLGEVLHGVGKIIKRTPLETFVNDTQNLKEGNAAIEQGKIPIGDGNFASQNEVAALIPEQEAIVAPRHKADYSNVPQVVDNPIADEALIAGEVEKTLTATSENIKRDPSFLPWKITKQSKDYTPRSKDLINADIEASNQLVTEVQSKIDDATARMNNREQFNSKTRNSIKINELPELRKQLIDAEFMRAQAEAELNGKRAVMKSTYELDRDANRFDKLLANEKIKAEAEHRAKLAEYKAQQKEIAIREKEIADTKAINDHAQWLHDNLDDKSIEGLSNKLLSHKAAISNKLDLMWQKMSNEMSILSSHVNGTRYIMKALRGEEIPDKELGMLARSVADEWERIGYEGVKVMREAGINTGWLKGRFSRLIHNADVIRKTTVEKWMSEVNPRLEVPMSVEEAKIRHADIVNVRAELKSVLEQEQEIENLSRRFKFKSADDEFWYMQNYGQTFTPHQAMARNIAEVSDKAAIVNVLGDNPIAVINKFGEITKSDTGVIQGLADEVFPKVLGYKETPAQAITFMNLLSAGARLSKAILNPAYQWTYGVTDAQNAILHVAQKTSTMQALKYAFRETPNFTKDIAKLPQEELKKWGVILNELKQEITATNAHGYGLLDPNGKLNAVTNFARDLEFGINGSHLPDKTVRNMTSKMYAYLMRDAYREGRQVLEGVDNKLLANAIDDRGFLNPYKLLNSNDMNDRRLGLDLLAKFQEGIDAVNPSKSKAWGSVAKDSAGALSWVRMSGWMMKTAMRTNIPLLKKMASNEMGGVAKLRAGGLLLGWAAIQTATEESFKLIMAAYTGEKHEFDAAEAAKTFGGLLVFGGMYWSYKLTSMPVLNAGKSIYYAGKGYLEDDDRVSQLEDYAKSQKAISNASYIAKLILNADYNDSSHESHGAYDLGNHDD